MTGRNACPKGGKKQLKKEKIFPLGCQKILISQKTKPRLLQKLAFPFVVSPLFLAPKKRPYGRWISSFFRNARRNERRKSPVIMGQILRTFPVVLPLAGEMIFPARLADALLHAVVAHARHRAFLPSERRRRDCRPPATILRRTGRTAKEKGESVHRLAENCDSKNAILHSRSFSSSRIRARKKGAPKGAPCSAESRFLRDGLRKTVLFFFSRIRTGTARGRTGRRHPCPSRDPCSVRTSPNRRHS